MKPRTDNSPTAPSSLLSPRGAPRAQLSRILVPTDFSEGADKALRYAVIFAKKFHAELLILHVLEPAPPIATLLDDTLMGSTLRADIARRLQHCRKQAGPAIKVTTRLSQSKVAHKEITRVARETNADLIIIGNRGRNVVGRALMGSTAEKVVRFAPCPVLVIREHEHDFIPVAS